MFTFPTLTLPEYCSQVGRSTEQFVGKDRTKVPKVDENAAGCVQNFIFEVVIGEFDGVLSHFNCS